MTTVQLSLDQNFDITKDLQFWMTNLPPKLKLVPLINLAIPGSHDSTTYGINEKSKISPDAEPILQKLSFLGPLLTTMMVRWSKTQLIHVREQLENGIRYFDLRISTNKIDDDFYFVHGLYAEQVGPVLEEIKNFLEMHPKEVIILDCQHFYAFDLHHHDRLMCLLGNIFMHKLLPYTSNMEHITLQYMSDCGYQVILIYRSDAARFGQPLLWPAACFPTPWPDTVSISKLITFLILNLKKRSPSVGFISQCVLTPSPWFITKHLFSTLKTQCWLPLEKEKYRWLKKQCPGRGGINIIISDFVDSDEGTFARAVVDLNKKLIEGDKSPAITPICDSN